MTKLKTWLKAARPRTVLLSFSGVLMGGLLAASQPLFFLMPMFLAALTAILLQILSNLANDYGDFKKGIDNADRVGPQRVMQSGALNEKQMRIGILVTVALCLVSGLSLLLSVAWAQENWNKLPVLAVLGLSAIVAALCYTLGKRPYGYQGLGDLFCFLFFGWVAVAGTYYLSVPEFDFAVFLPASAMGLMSVAVLNINNMRDYENDKANGKNTMVVRLGLQKAFCYHVFLIVGAFVGLSVFLGLKHSPWYAYAFWLLFPLFLKDLINIHKSLVSGIPDYFLPKQVFHAFLLTVVFGAVYLLV